MKKILFTCTIFFLTACIIPNALGDSRGVNDLPHERQPMKLVTTISANHEILRQRATEVTFPLDAETKEFIQIFQTTFFGLKSPFKNPAGLAAPQVGLSKRIAIIQIPEEAKKIRKYIYDIIPPTILINPTYTPVEADGKYKDWEACYSVPNQMSEVYRYRTIHYQAYTVDGKKISGTAKGFFARLLQHEIGHLNGQLYIDLLPCEGCRSGAMDEMMEIRKKEME